MFNVVILWMGGTSRYLGRLEQAQGYVKSFWRSLTTHEEVRCCRMVIKVDPLRLIQCWSNTRADSRIQRVRGCYSVVIKVDPLSLMQFLSKRRAVLSRFKGPADNGG